MSLGHRSPFTSRALLSQHTARFRQLSGCNRTEEGSSCLAPQPYSIGGSRAPHPQPARPGHAAHPSCASRPGQPVRSFPNIFCIHLVNKFYILLISSADGLSTRRGGGGRLPVPALQPLRATRCVRSAPARPASDEEIFLFWWLFHHIDVANRLRSSPAPLLT